MEILTSCLRLIIMLRLKFNRVHLDVKLENFELFQNKIVIKNFSESRKVYDISNSPDIQSNNMNL